MGISVWQLLIILVIIMLLFGTKKLRNMGADLGGALKSFRKAVKTEDAPQDEGKMSDQESGRVFEGEVAAEEKDKNKSKSKSKNKDKVTSGG